MRLLADISADRTNTVKTLDPLDQSESPAAHSAAVAAFELAALSSSLSGDVSLRDNDAVVK